MKNMIENFMGLYVNILSLPYKKIMQGKQTTFLDEGFQK